MSPLNSRLTPLFKAFFNSERSAGITLILCTIASLYLANSIFGTEYRAFWHTDLLGLDLLHWINDGLMTIFFLLIGLELEREFYGGELSNLKSALLPIAAAIGGMCIPALIYFIFNYNTPFLSGAGIPTATDIAFALGALSLLGNSVPSSLKVFLTAFAVIDDLCAIIIIALFYSSDISLFDLSMSFLTMGGLFVLNRLNVHRIFPYLVGGVVMWYFMEKSGVHPSIIGVLLAFVMPYGDGGKKTSSYRVQKFLHYPVPFLVMPIFAIANTAILFESNFHHLLLESYSMGIGFGLTLGKPLGIFLFCFIAVKLGLCSLPKRVNWKGILGVGFLGGIGFTMSIFIALLAFDDPQATENCKLMILLGSLVSGLIGLLFLHFISFPKKINPKKT